MCVHVPEEYSDEKLIQQWHKYTKIYNDSIANDDEGWALYIKKDVDKLEKEFANRGMPLPSEVAV